MWKRRLMRTYSRLCTDALKEADGILLAFPMRFGMLPAQPVGGSGLDAASYSALAEWI
ncbi:hypothetical protein PR002_g4725 [Phytophthora rubi]|uniref:Uncharacterized protein n=1 Tax=Phytophthora rubi TaxID=129364 RepID=A0A6A3NHX9_9STRA|nr:hypothetical protein PR002_g4725 [Phytophthora rubi]